MTIPSRPDGGAWSNVHDLLRYLQMELRQGLLPHGERYIATAPLLARRVQQVATGADSGYGMGLRIDRSLGTPIFHHGGTAFGGRAEMLWLPEHQVGVVILSNAGVGGIRGLIQRRVMELLFDGHREAKPNTPVLAKMFRDSAAAERESLTVPAEPKLVARLAARYRNDALGDLRTQRDGDATWFDFGGWRSEVATRRGDDGTNSFVTTSASAQGFEFVVSDRGDERSLILRDEQHEYIFTAVE